MNGQSDFVYTERFFTAYKIAWAMIYHFLFVGLCSSILCLVIGYKIAIKGERITGIEIPQTEETLPLYESKHK